MTSYKHGKVPCKGVANQMKPHTKAAAASAAIWALVLSSGFILGPIVIGLANGAGLSEEIIATKLVAGVGLFPLLFFGLWAWGTFFKKNPITGAQISPSDCFPVAATTKQESISARSSPPAKAGKWNYVGIGVGAFMLLFAFLPQMISGTLRNGYLGAALWVGVIICCSINIFRANAKNENNR